MELVVISFSFLRGGAAIAASRFVSIARDLELTVVNIRCVSQDGGCTYFHWAKRLFSFFVGFLQFDSNRVKHSLNLFTFPQVAREFESNENLLHLHWFNNDTLGLARLKELPAGSIVTLHDEWLYCGAEHYFNPLSDKLDFVLGYRFFSRRYLGFNVGYFVWRSKVRSLRERKDIIFTVPSRWLLERAKSSVVLKSADIRLLPNPINTEQFSKASSSEISKFRRSFGLADDDCVIAFGAVGGKASYIKGGNLLDAALEMVTSRLIKLGKKLPKVINFGGRPEGWKKVFGLETISLGHVDGAAKLALLYSSVDFVVVPSLVEAFGQVAAESLACETPVVCFSGTGLSDVVVDGVTGLTALPYSVADLAEKILQMINMNEIHRCEFGLRGRQHIVSSFSYPVVSALYKNIIEDAVVLKGSRS
ncbi:glycosyltransferase [Pseudomonas sp. GD03909]|nr:glycosyltransferase [Pseudomonas sp. GD03909]